MTRVKTVVTAVADILAAVIVKAVVTAVAKEAANRHAKADAQVLVNPVVMETVAADAPVLVRMAPTNGTIKPKARRKPGSRNSNRNKGEKNNG